MNRTLWMFLALYALVFVACGNDDDDDDSAADYEFVEYEWLTEEPDVTGTRLCPDWADPEAAEDKVFIDCDSMGENLSDGPVPAQNRVMVMAYNAERGQKIEEQIDALLNDPAFPQPDILLLSETDRGCSRSGSQNVTRRYAEALGMYYVFGVEFVELPRDNGGGGITETCEHGNAILSRWPLGNVRIIRHATNKSWYIPPEERDGGGEPRLGGRVMIYADTKIGEKILHLYTVHYESSPADGEYRDAQAAETAEDGLSKPYQVVIGGDTNAPFYFLDLELGGNQDQTTAEFFSRGYVDAHADLPLEQRPTLPPKFIVDLIFGNGEFFSDSGVCQDADCGGLSDHMPVWTTVTLQ